MYGKWKYKFRRQGESIILKLKNMIESSYSNESTVNWILSVGLKFDDLLAQVHVMNIQGKRSDGEGIALKKQLLHSCIYVHIAL